MSDRDPNVTSLTERIKGKAKRAAGALTGNETLKREGELHEEKADAVVEADRLDEQAEVAREKSKIDIRERELALQEQHLANEERADAARERIDEERQRAEQRIDARYEAHERSVEGDASAVRSAVTREEARAAAEHAAATRKAAEIEDEARRARAAAEALERATDDSTN